MKSITGWILNRLLGRITLRDLTTELACSSNDEIDALPTPGQSSPDSHL